MHISKVIRNGEMTMFGYLSHIQHIPFWQSLSFVLFCYSDTLIFPLLFRSSGDILVEFFLPFHSLIQIHTLHIYPYRILQIISRLILICGFQLELQCPRPGVGNTKEIASVEDCIQIGQEM